MISSPSPDEAPSPLTYFAFGITHLQARTAACTSCGVNGDSSEPVRIRFTTAGAIGVMALA